MSVWPVLSSDQPWSITALRRVSMSRCAASDERADFSTSSLRLFTDASSSPCLNVRRSMDVSSLLTESCSCSSLREEVGIVAPSGIHAVHVHVSAASHPARFGFGLPLLSNDTVGTLQSQILLQTVMSFFLSMSVAVKHVPTYSGARSASAHVRYW